MTQKNCFFNFETNKIDKENYQSYYFEKPIKVLRLTDPKKLTSFFNELESLTQKYYAAGFFSYEIGYLLEHKFDLPKRYDFPYAYFGIFKKPRIVDERVRKPQKGDNRKTYKISNLRMSTTKKQYLKDINKVKKYIKKGDTYQVNYTSRYKFKFNGSLDGLYEDLKEKQHVPYSVFGKAGKYKIISLSPELFFSKKGRRITVKPMKGTIERGKTTQEDKIQINTLKKDPKNKSENIMIVDLLRNDLSKISEYGSVKVESRYDIEKYDTLFQMTSTIKSRLKSDVSLYKFIKSIFPSGSVTGAPKIRSMEIIKDLEKSPRKIYTGALGFIEPGGNAKFNVAIRTVLIEGDEGEMGIGGGIVDDSEPMKEYEEAKLKGKFLIDKPVRFQIIETLLYDNRYVNLNYHLNRMKDSAEYFNYYFNLKELKGNLNRLKSKLVTDKYKVRILLSRDGGISISCEKLKCTNIFKLKLSKILIDNSNIFYYHKTTNRDLYIKELERARKDGFFDVIFLNKDGYVTEGAISNIYIEDKGRMVTPPLRNGLLNGTFRQNMLNKGKVKEKSFRLNDLRKAKKTFISNAIIGFKEAVW